MIKKLGASHQTLASCLLLVLAVLAIYGQTWGFDFVNWDDDEYVRDHHVLLQGLSLQALWWGLTTFDMSNWHPLTWWSYLLDVTLFGLSAAAMHLENALWHALNSVLLYLLFARATARQLPSLLLALLFAIHPLHVESVAWIAERKDVLSTFFLLATLWQYWRYLQHRQRVYYWLSVLLAALGMMTKPMLVTLPLLLLIFDYWPSGRLQFDSGWRAGLRRLSGLCLEKWPFFALAGMGAMLTLLAQSRGGSMRTLSMVAPLERIINALVSYSEYILTTLLPFKLSFMYVYRARAAWELALALALLSALTFYAARRRGPVLAGWLWFLISLLPVIGLIQVGDQLRADRYMYVPMIGLAMMALFGGLQRASWSALPAAGRWGLVLSGVALMVLAWMQTGTWRNPDTLLLHALRQDPGNHIAHTLLAQRYGELGQREPALAHADAAIRLRPQSPAAARAANAAASLLLRNKEYALAQAYLQTALRADAAYADSYYNLGEIALRGGRYTEAMRLYEYAIELAPDYSEAYNNLGIACRLSGDLPRAVAAFEKAVALDPLNATALRNLESGQARLQSAQAGGEE